VTVLLVRALGEDGSATGGGPVRLVDGSAALAEPTGFPRGVRGVVHVRRADRSDASDLAACERMLGLRRLPAETLVVERIGVDGRSLTFRDPRTRRVYGCDASARTAEAGGPWCGAVVGTLARGRLTDPRLDLANCRDAAGDAVAFVWVDAPRAAEWLAVERYGEPEYYRAGGGIPVRIASAVAVSGPDSAVVSVTLYGPGARERGRLTVRATVAG
jgi:hypothetical protein